MVETATKAARYDESLKTWWRTYSERKNDEEEEHVADSLLYDYRTSAEDDAGAELSRGSIGADVDEGDKGDKGDKVNCVRW